MHCSDRTTFGRQGQRVAQHMLTIRLACSLSRMLTGSKTCRVLRPVLEKASMKSPTPRFKESSMLRKLVYSRRMALMSAHSSDLQLMRMQAVMMGI
jgi:hypothetical protein